VRRRTRFFELQKMVVDAAWAAFAVGDAARGDRRVG
jgi:hypothetical protein